MTGTPLQEPSPGTDRPLPCPLPPDGISGPPPPFPPAAPAGVGVPLSGLEGPAPTQVVTERLGAPLVLEP